MIFSDGVGSADDPVRLLWTVVARLGWDDDVRESIVQVAVRATLNLFLLPRPWSPRDPRLDPERPL